MNIKNVISSDNTGLDPRWFGGYFKGYNTAYTSNRTVLDSDFDAVKLDNINTLRVFIKIVKNGEGRYYVTDAERTFHELFIRNARRVSLYVIPVLQIDPAGSNSAYWLDSYCREDIGNIIREFAGKYWNNDTVIALDVLNEPVIKTSSISAVRELNYSLWKNWIVYWIECMREVLPYKTAIVEAPEWGYITSSAIVGGVVHEGGLIGVGLLPLKNIVYSYHYYSPHSFTHQSIGTNPRNVEYPMIGQITSIVPSNNGGSGYTSTPTITLSSPPEGGRQATAVANISGGRITSVVVTDAGKGYVTAPTATLSGGGGSGTTLIVEIGTFSVGNIIKDFSQIASWAKYNNVALLLGETSCNYYAPLSQRTAYLNDVLGCCTRFGINWIYHSIWEWRGWDSEYQNIAGVESIIPGGALKAAILSHL